LQQVGQGLGWTPHNLCVEEGGKMVGMGQPIIAGELPQWEVAAIAANNY